MTRVREEERKANTTRVREEERKRDRQILQDEDRLIKSIKYVRFERNKENENMEI